MNDKASKLDFRGHTGVGRNECGTIEAYASPLFFYGSARGTNRALRTVFKAASGSIWRTNRPIFPDSVADVYFYIGSLRPCMALRAERFRLFST
jgi:hypothetical protein